MSPDVPKLATSITLCPGHEFLRGASVSPASHLVLERRSHKLRGRTAGFASVAFTGLAFAGFTCQGLGSKEASELLPVLEVLPNFSIRLGPRCEEDRVLLGIFFFHEKGNERLSDLVDQWQAVVVDFVCQWFVLEVSSISLLTFDLLVNSSVVLDHERLIRRATFLTAVGTHAFF